MKCNRCGKEFGDGIACQFCGTDLVEGLGFFAGYHPNMREKDFLTPGVTTPGGIFVSNSDNMLCLAVEK